MVWNWLDYFASFLGFLTCLRMFKAVSLVCFSCLFHGPLSGKSLKGLKSQILFASLLKCQGIRRTWKLKSTRVSQLGIEGLTGRSGGECPDIKIWNDHVFHPSAGSRLGLQDGDTDLQQTPLHRNHHQIQIRKMPQTLHHR